MSRPGVSHVGLGLLVLAAADDASCHLELRREVTWNLRLRIHDAGNT